MLLLDEGQVRSRILDYLRSREWWCFIPDGDVGHEALQAIEERFYAGDANVDFHLLMGGVLFPIAFGRKSRMTPAQFCKLVIDRGAPKEYASRLSERDIVGLGENNESSECVTLKLEALSAWLGPL
tara:strand:+ start:2285 stop:2662 length:378 start_codon:yes stop_codon:yes gene_type:complete